MATGVPPATSGHFEMMADAAQAVTQTMDLQQQVARLQALLEASRQVHSTIREEEVLESVLRIVVRELEMAGAAFPGAGLAYGEGVAAHPDTEAGPASGNGAALPSFPLHDR